MKTKHELTETQSKVLNFIEKTPNCTQKVASQKTKLKPVVLGNAIRALMKLKLVLETKNKEGNTYQLNEKSAPKKESTEKVVKPEKSDVKTESKKKTAISKRDMTKYELLNGSGERHGKSRMVLAIVSQWAKDHPKATLKDFEKAFPVELQKGYGGVFKKTVEVKKNDLVDRFFMNAEQIIKTAEAPIAVCREFGVSNIGPVLEVAKKLGYKIKEHKEG